MDYKEIKELTEKELHSGLREEREILLKLKFNHAVSPIENPKKISESKKTIAKYLTEISARRKKANQSKEHKA